MQPPAQQAGYQPMLPSSLQPTGVIVCPITVWWRWGEAGGAGDAPVVYRLAPDSLPAYRARLTSLSIARNRHLAQWANGLNWDDEWARGTEDDLKIACERAEADTLPANHPEPPTDTQIALWLWRGDHSIIDSAFGRRDVPSPGDPRPEVLTVRAVLVSRLQPLPVPGAPPGSCRAVEPFVRRIYSLDGAPFTLWINGAAQAPRAEWTAADLAAAGGDLCPAGCNTAARYRLWAGPAAGGYVHTCRSDFSIVAADDPRVVVESENIVLADPVCEHAIRKFGPI